MLYQAAQRRRPAVALAAQLPQLLREAGSGGRGGAQRRSGGGSIGAGRGRCVLSLPWQLRHIAQCPGQMLG